MFAIDAFGFTAASMRCAASVSFGRLIGHVACRPVRRRAPAGPRHHHGDARRSRTGPGVRHVRPGEGHGPRGRSDRRCSLLRRSAHGVRREPATGAAHPARRAGRACPSCTTRSRPTWICSGSPAPLAALLVFFPRSKDMNWDGPPGPSPPWRPVSPSSPSSAGRSPAKRRQAATRSSPSCSTCAPSPAGVAVGAVPFAVLTGSSPVLNLFLQAWPATPRARRALAACLGRSA